MRSLGSHSTSGRAKEGKDGIYIYINIMSYCPWSHELSASVAVPPAPVRVSSQRSLVPSVTSVVNDKGDTEMILRVVHRPPGMCLTGEENPGKPQIGDHLMKGL